MLIFTFVTTLFLPLLAAFQPVIKDNVIIRGSTPPFPDFDPLHFSDNKDIAYLREAELKHARWAMVGSSAIPLIESSTHRPAIYEFQHLSDTNQLLLVGLITATEFQFMLQGWQNPWVKEFELKDSYQPGDLGFALMSNKNSQLSLSFMDKELNNGRLAMIAFVGILAQELVSNTPLFP